MTDSEGLEGAGAMGNDEGAILTTSGAGINGNTASNPLTVRAAGC